MTPFGSLGRRVVLAAFAAAWTSCCFVVVVAPIAPLIEGRERVGPLRSSSKGLPDRLPEFVRVLDLLRASPELRGLADEVSLELDHGRSVTDFAFVYVDVVDGYLVGLDHGEWGGALWWISHDYQVRSLLAAENVRGIVADRASAIAICGLAHLVIDEGELVRLVKDGGWRPLDTMPLRAAPWSFVLGPDGELELASWNGDVVTYKGGAIR